MPKNDKAIYAPGELSRVREKLGVFDRKEADELARKLGGEVGYERDVSTEPGFKPIKRGTSGSSPGGSSGGSLSGSLGAPAAERSNSAPSRKRSRSQDGAESKKGAKEKHRRKRNAVSVDDPSVPFRVSYFDRIRMDRFAGLSEFDIKDPGQVFYSIISIFKPIPDNISPFFVSHRMSEYYKKIEDVVLSIRNLFPRNNTQRNERMKTGAALVYSILDVIRHWDIEKISAELGKIQTQNKTATVSDFAEILRLIYCPLYILELLDFDIHIRGAYKILYKVLYLENPEDAESKQELIRTSLSALFGIRQNIHYLLYPLLMKSVSPNYVSYDDFFNERKNRIMAFLNVKETDRINPGNIVWLGDPNDAKDEEQALGVENNGQTGDAQAKSEEAKEEASEKEKARKAAEEASRKALDRGLLMLDKLFPQSGWYKADSFPDFYPYFSGLFKLHKGAVNISPSDPLQQVLILMHILEELFFAVRHVSFGATLDISNGIEDMNVEIGGIIGNWRHYIETGFGKEYLPRLAEYIRILEGAYEARLSMYCKKIITEMQWLKRLYFLPHYKFESLLPPPYRKGDISPIYSEVKKLRKYFSIAAAGIEDANRAGGAEAHASCGSVDNLWAPYVFDVPNPVSVRMNAFIAPKKRNNATLIYFCLAVTTVLDHLINNEKSWAYGSRTGPLFRSVKGEGQVPLTGVDEKIDADEIFKQTLKQMQQSPPALP
ncbi:MAG: hypothetical protein FWD91_01995 [Treponema sp.]|nr:hypothetical protein [Treponema sp.]